MLITTLSDLGALIRRRRSELGLSQSDLAERTGTTRQWVSRLERGKNDIGAIRLLAVLDVLELNLDVRTPRAQIAGLPSTDVHSIVPASTIEAIARHTGIDELASTFEMPSNWDDPIDPSGLSDSINDISRRILMRRSTRRPSAPETVRVERIDVGDSPTHLTADDRAVPGYRADDDT